MSKGAKIIFLDFDGVIRTTRASIAIGETGMLTYLDPIACKLVEKLITDHGARIVISSTWRNQHKKRDIYYLLKSAGHHIICGAMHERWCTPHFRDGRSRGHEIEVLLSEIESHEHVESYVILDDDNDMLSYQQKHFVNTDGHDGLGFEDWRAADKILGGDNWTHIF